MESIAWIAILIVMLVIEIVTTGLATIWFCGGAAVALAVSAAGGPLWLQILLFAAVSVILLVVTRPIAMKHLNARTVATNADSLVGEEAVVTEPIDNISSTGAVQIHGQLWTARATDEAVSAASEIPVPAGTAAVSGEAAASAGHYVIPKDSIVVIRAIEGVKLMVEPAGRGR